MRVIYCFRYIAFSILLEFHSLVLAQNGMEVKQVNASLDQFALKFLAETSNQAGDDWNLALSPYTVYSLMVIISEGAKGNTATELDKTLGIPSNQDKVAFRKEYASFGKHLRKENDPGVTLDITNSIFTAPGQKLKQTFRDIAKSNYHVDLSEVNFDNTKIAARTINSQVNTATKGRIIDFVTEDDLSGARVFMTSTLYFKGIWDNQFDRNSTTKQPFYAENGTQIAEVDMMHESGPYPFSLIFNNKATAVELPYKGNSMAMIVLLPKKNVSLKELLEMLAAAPFSDVVNALDKAIEDFGEEPVYVYLPKFRVISDLNMNFVLHKMGIKDIFNATEADLSGMFYDPLFISRIIQRAEIEVDEEGTVASAAAGAAFEYKSPPARFVANKPFAYIIYDKETRGIVFVGKISNPLKIK